MAENPVLVLAGEYAVSGQSGTLMVVFDDNSMGRFYVAGGLLATARYRNKEGQEALDLARPRSVASVRFHENSDLVRSAALIEGVSLPEPAASPAPAPAPAAPQQVAATPMGPPLSNAMRAALEDLLSEYVGPVASVLLSDLPDNVDADTAVEQTAREISSIEDAAAYVRQARRIVGR